MCIAIYNPAAAADLTYDTLARCKWQNSDGMGMMWASGGKIHTFRTMKDLESFWQVYKSVRSLGHAVVMHFRYATHGVVGLTNTHPFFVPDTDEQLAFVHNGVLDVPSTDDVSDTRMFGYHFLRYLGRDWMDNPITHRVIADAIGGSKLIVMDATGKVAIIGEGRGVWDQGTWYSNTGYKSYSSYGRRSVHGDTYDDWDDYWDKRSRDTAASQREWSGSTTAAEAQEAASAPAARSRSRLRAEVDGAPTLAFAAYSSCLICWDCAREHQDEITLTPVSEFELRQLANDPEQIVCDFCQEGLHDVFYNTSTDAEQEEIEFVEEPDDAEDLDFPYQIEERIGADSEDAAAEEGTAFNERLREEMQELSDETTAEAYWDRVRARANERADETQQQFVH